MMAARTRSSNTDGPADVRQRSQGHSDPLMRRRRTTIAVLLVLATLAVGVAAILHSSLDRRFVGSWKEVSGGAFGPRRILTFLPDGTAHDVAWNEQGVETGAGISWHWRTSSEHLFLRGHTPQPAAQRRWKTFLNAAFDEFYRRTSGSSQNDESSFRILEVEARRFVVEQRFRKGDAMQTRQLVFERVD
jgi:hypothetical protein